MSHDVLGIDVGATSIKFQRFDASGADVGKRARRATQFPCPPETLLSVIDERLALWPSTRIGLGFPGAVRDGVVLDGANLGRIGGAGTPFDPDLQRLWLEFPLQSVLRERTGATVHVANDAALAALGCALDQGNELVVTLGTGFGLSLVRDGRLADVRDVGDELLHSDETYDALLGELGRRSDPGAWMVHVVSAVIALADEFDAPTIHLAGGNARRLSPRAFGDWAPHVIIERDQPGLRGAWRMFYP